MKALFQLGRLFITPAAHTFSTKNSIDPLALVVRHVNGDFGDLCPEDVKSNLEAIVTGARILSSYQFGQDKIWIITEAVGDGGQRASTCILMPDDY